MTTALRTHTTLSLGQAVDSAPSLAVLQQRIRESQRYLEWIEPVLPSNLRKQVKAGPVEDTEWCLLVSNASVSTKVRQLLPALLTILNENGARIKTIRVKVQVSGGC